MNWLNCCDGSGCMKCKIVCYNAIKQASGICPFLDKKNRMYMFNL